MKMTTLHWALAISTILVGAAACTVTSDDETDGGAKGGSAGAAGAAGSATGGTGTGGTGTGGTGTGGTGTGGTGGGGGAAGEAGSGGGGNECQTCVDTNCSAAYAACTAITECSDAIGCMNDCDAGDAQTCANSCMAGGTTGDEQFNALYLCVWDDTEGQCKTECAIQ